MTDLMIDVPTTSSVRSIGVLHRHSVRTRLWITFVTVIVALGSISMLFPVYFMFVTSLKGTGSTFILPLKWLPYVEFQPVWKNYPDALEFMNATVVFANTLKISLIASIGDALSAVCVAYGFARFRAPGRDLLFLVMLATLMIPFAVRLVPEYLGFSLLGMVDTYWPLILPPWLGSAFNIFLLRQFFTTIPLAMDEAAEIDGAGPIRTLLQVLVPQIKPAIIVVLIGSFTANYNDFLRPLIYLNSAENRTAAVALSFFRAMYGGTPYNLLMSAALVMLVPVVVLFFTLQRYFIQGIVISGVKG